MAVPYLTADEVRARRPELGDPDKYTDSELESLVAEFEEIAERFRGVAFTPRTVTETITKPQTSILLTRWPVRSVTSFTVAGTAGTVDDLTVDTSVGTVYGGGWSTSTAVAVTYDYGLDEPPATLLRACAEYVRAVAFADRSGTSRDVISQSFEGGFTRFSTPDWNAGRPTGFLEVDRLLGSLPDYRVPGVA